ncbi:MAG: translational GTPase TypA [Alphaproteobacteria bacterium]|nr:MAG: translational GTPase TypA [Alphaproteobacteria bacterium]
MNLRNIAIIAHVDHGKTTLVDQMLRQSGTFRENQNVAERVMDSNDLEKERGITIMSKVTSIIWKDTRINIVDTPGHSDFGGEVERILSMVDGVVVLVDAAEGAMPQTKFVVSKALKLGLKPIVLINKIDRSDARIDEVHHEVFDLFAALDATDEQLDFPLLYAVGRDGWAVANLNDTQRDLTALFDLILKHVPAPSVDENAPFSMLISMIEADNFLGRILTGRIYSGKVKVNDTLKSMKLNGEAVEQGRITKIQTFRGIERISVDEASAGDIIMIAGLPKTTVSDTVAAPSVAEPIKATPVDPPTLAMTFSVNNSPLAGREGSKVTSRMIRDRLFREAEGNVAIRVRDAEGGDAVEVSGRGELQLGVLIETMRREGFELSISRPKVLLQKDEATGETLEPYEEIMVDVDQEYSGVVVEKMAYRKSEMTDMRPSGGNKVRITFHGPARGMIGYHGEFLTDTRGTGIMNRSFKGYGPYKGQIGGRINGVMISREDGEAVAYALWNLEERGEILINPGDKIYKGMIIGEHSRDNDLDVVPNKAKQLTNIRTKAADEAIRLTPPRIMSLEDAIAYIQDDELVEVTPKSLRLRKKLLDMNDRARAAKDAKKEAEKAAG